MDNKKKISINLNKKEYLLTYKQTILEHINNNKCVLIDSNPGTGKTSLFVEVADDIKNNKHTGRLIFCAPFLIIQSQFAVALSEKGHSIDLLLNANSERKELVETDKIICSTYQSLKHIASTLNENDIIVLDEAHSLGYSYTTNKKDSLNISYFDDEVSLLLQLPSKIVLMTGTPDTYINKLFNLTHIKVHKENENKANITIYNSQETAVSLAVTFAESTIKEYTTDYLNTIFINSTNQCEIINDKLQALGYKSKVLTSHHKKGETYKELVERMIISDDINFLVCTSVISTGANIKNKKIGKALVLFESNPKEIKQFSKRFRQKLNLDVDVVNKPAKAGVTTTAQISADFDKLITLIDTVKKLDIPENYTNTSKSPIGTKSDILKQFTKRYLMQYAYLEKQRSIEFKAPSLLKQELDKYSDITTKIKTSNSTKELTKTNSIDASKLDEILTQYSKEFILNYRDFSYEIVNGEYTDYYYQNEFKYKVATYLELKNGSSNDKIRATISSPYFEQKLLAPVINNFEYIKYLPETIYLTNRLSNNSDNRKLNKLLFTLFFNRFIHTHLNIQREDFTKKYEIKRNEKTTFGYADKAIFKLINLTFNYCLLSDNIPLETLKNHLETKFSSLIVFRDLPFKLVDKNGFIKEMLRCLIDAIFYTKVGQNKKTQSDGTIKSSVIFESEFPTVNQVYPEKGEFYKKIRSSYLTFNNDGTGFGVPTLIKIIPSPELIIYNHLDVDYFTLILNPPK
ncbi:hypothetical protein KUL156_54100 [Alteromonas sp. KUL156]|nr:hypothetical protein KUL154_10710 [Alteromonas sp. KUL154]GFE02818.1 hypothetical protein KUL156_54100 [Alteromonas sp. KUL156]